MKRFFAILIVLAACLALFCVTAGAENIPNDVTWEEISSESQLRWEQARIMPRSQRTLQSKIRRILKSMEHSLWI